MWKHLACYPAKNFEISSDQLVSDDFVYDLIDTSKNQSVITVHYDFEHLKEIVSVGVF